MKITITQPTEVDFKYIHCLLPYREDDDVPECLITNDKFKESPYGEKCRGKFLDFFIDVDARKIYRCGLPWLGGEFVLYIKVSDSGRYQLISEDNSGEVYTASGQIQDYIPNCIPNDYGDYINLEIAEDGTITNWIRTINFDEFFK